MRNKAMKFSGTLWTNTNEQGFVSWTIFLFREPHDKQPDGCIRFSSATLSSDRLYDSVDEAQEAACKIAEDLGVVIGPGVELKTPAPRKKRKHKMSYIARSGAAERTGAKK